MTHDRTRPTLSAWTASLPGFWRAAAPWVSLATLWLLFELPAALRSSAPAISALRFSLELPLLLTAWGVYQASPCPPRLRWALRALLIVATGALIAYRIDQWLCLLLLREDPLLYDQWFMVRHLWVLIGDLMSLQTLLALLGFGLGSWLLTRLTRVLLGRARALFEPAQRVRTAKLVFGLWAVLLLASTALRARPDPVLTWLTPALVHNVQQSLAVYRSVQTRLARSPYAGYSRISLSERPDVLLFIVESYGRLLSVEASTRGPHAQLLDELGAELARTGWHVASAFSTSPVNGGRSWLAEGTVLMGTPIRYEAVFHHILSQAPPNLIGFLNGQGYESVLLAPADRDRPGVHVVNRYGFSQVLSYNRLGYRGPKVGWGIVPDQYSLAVAEQRVLRSRTRPVVLDFHMVTSHAPWAQVPELEAQPIAPGNDGPSTPVDERTATNAVLSRLANYQRDADARYSYMDRFDAQLRRGYQATITYDLRVITQYLARRKDDALVVVFGDHQPPVIDRADPSFDAPVHLLSRDPERLAEPLRQGFVPGLALAASAPPALSHAGLFSLLVRTLLARACRDCPLPAALPQGAPLLSP
jgi:hypothetical protein